jgi:hypothetical protein
MRLLERVRGNVEAAPWVLSEISALERKIESQAREIEYANNIIRNQEAALEELRTALIAAKEVIDDYTGDPPKDAYARYKEALTRCKEVLCT